MFSDFHNSTWISEIRLFNQNIRTFVHFWPCWFVISFWYSMKTVVIWDRGLGKNFKHEYVQLLWFFLSDLLDFYVWFFSHDLTLKPMIGSISFVNLCVSSTRALALVNYYPKERKIDFYLLVLDWIINTYWITRLFFLFCFYCSNFMIFIVFFQLFPVHHKLDNILITFSSDTGNKPSYKISCTLGR